MNVHLDLLSLGLCSTYPLSEIVSLLLLRAVQSPAPFIAQEVEYLPSKISHPRHNDDTPPACTVPPQIPTRMMAALATRLYSTQR